MKKFLTILIALLVGIGIYVGYQVLQKKQYNASYYVEQVNIALKNNQPQEAFDFVNEGILLFPNRLDLRFGKTYMCQMLGDMKCVKDELLKILQHSATNNNPWLWMRDEIKDNEFMLEILQNYQKNLWNEGYFVEMRELAEEVLKYFPDNIESLNTMAVSYLIEGNWQEAEPYLKTAHQIKPDDKIVNKNLQKLAEIKNSRNVEYQKKRE